MRTFEARVRGLMDEWRVPGVAVAIVQDGAVLYAAGLGRRDATTDQPITPQTVFPIASCTKPLTAMAIGILADEGRLSWDAPVREYLPTFRMGDPVATERTTLRDLATHRTGLPAHSLAWYGSPRPMAVLLERLPQLELSADFRTTYQYQNLLSAVAGHAAGCVAGGGWEGLVRERVFAPLGMIRSVCSPEELDPTDDLAFPHVETPASVRRVPFERMGAIAPAGGVCASVEDVAAWLLVHLTGGRRGAAQLISEATLRELQRPQMVTPHPVYLPELSHVLAALEWNVLAFRGELLVRPGGVWAGVRALVSFMPRRGLGVVCLANLHQTLLPEAVTYHAYEHLLGLAETAWSQRLRGAIRRGQSADDASLDGPLPRHADDYLGEYSHPGYGRLSVATEEDGNDVPHVGATLNGVAGQLRSAPGDDGALEIAFTWPTGAATYPVTVVRDSSGRVTALVSQLEPSVRPITFTRVEV
jgi:CubicO group peptidase (beta-lactamase class C family)